MKTCTIMTDQDDKLVGKLSIEFKLHNNAIYGKTRNRLCKFCKWHKISTILQTTATVESETSREIT